MNRAYAMRYKLVSRQELADMLAVPDNILQLHPQVDSLWMLQVLECGEWRLVDFFPPDLKVLQDAANQHCDEVKK